MQYYDQVIEGKTGVSRFSAGLDPDVLQNTTAAAANAMSQAANGQVELIARNLAEGGMRQLFSLILKITRQHVDREVMVRLNGKFVPVDPRSWNAELDMVANVGLGTGGEAEKEMVLREVLQNQMMVYQSYGPQNGLVSLTNIRNTQADIMKLGGLMNVDRYIQPMDPEIEAQFMEQQAAMQEEPPDPNAALAQAEVQKAQITAQAKMQSDLARIQAQREADIAKLQQQGELQAAKLRSDASQIMMDDDRKRDEMLQKLEIETARILGEYGIKLDDQKIRAMQAANGQV